MTKKVPSAGGAAKRAAAARAGGHGSSKARSALSGRFVSQTSSKNSRTTWQSKSQSKRNPGATVTERNRSAGGLAVPSVGVKQRRYRVGPDVDLDATVVRDRQGQRITEARAQEIAEEVLERVGRRRGRPSLGESAGTSPAVSLRLPAGLRAKTLERAAAEGKSVSVVVREALERYLR